MHKKLCKRSFLEWNTRSMGNWIICWETPVKNDPIWVHSNRIPTIRWIYCTWCNVPVIVWFPPQNWGIITDGSYDILLDGKKAELKSLKGASNIHREGKSAINDQKADSVIFRFDSISPNVHKELNKLVSDGIHGFYYQKGTDGLYEFLYKSPDKCQGLGRVLPPLKASCNEHGKYT